MKVIALIENTCTAENVLGLYKPSDRHVLESVIHQLSEASINYDLIIRQMDVCGPTGESGYIAESPIELVKMEAQSKSPIFVSVDMIDGKIKTPITNAEKSNA